MESNRSQCTPKVQAMEQSASSPEENPSRDLDQEQARLAYTIIQSLLEHTRVVSDLIALMAQTLDEDTTKALTQTPVWTAYLDSRRAMERTRADVEKFAEIMKGLSED
jgi:predicted dinucleotide-binding enzyme